VSAHVLDSATHTISGKTAGQFLRATGATTYAFESISVSKGMTISYPVADTVTAWRATFPCTIVKVQAHMQGSSSPNVTVNAAKNAGGATGTGTNILSSNITLSTNDAWVSSTGISSAASSFAIDDELEVSVVGVTGTITELTIQVDMTRP